MSSADERKTDKSGTTAEKKCKVKASTVLIALFGIGAVLGIVLWGIIRNANSASQASNRTISVPVRLHPSSVLHIWLKTRTAAQSSPANVRLTGQTANFTLAQTDKHAEFMFHEVAPRLDGIARLEWFTGDTWVSYAYAYEPESVLEMGIRPAFIAHAARGPEVPEGFHFRPPLGWMNDPNGFSKLGPHFHLFYQHYPHALHWSSMHWGHAVSRDLVNWAHLPIFLLPDPSVGLDNDGKGGIFSGSAISLAMPKALRIFYTDNRSGRKPMEFQRMVTSLDGVHPTGQAQTIIPEGPANMNFTQDFRDPSVVMGPDGKWKMVLGSRDGGGGVMLLYGTDDPQAMSGWRFLNVLFRDSRLNMTVAECPGLVPIDGDPRDRGTLWALIYAQLEGTDPRTGRRNLSPAIVGTFDGFRFQPLFEQELDFGTDAYAFQAFHGADGTLAIAWLANWQDWDWDTRPDFPTAMTFPRRFLLSRDRRALLTPPLESALARLRWRRLDDGRLLQTGQVVPLPNGTAEIQIDILDGRTQPEAQQGRGAQLRLQIGHPSLSPVGVELSPEGLEILPGQAKDPPQRLIALGARPARVQILLDTGSIEVFADGGRWAGTVRLPGTHKFTGVRLSGDLRAVGRSEVWALRPAEFRGRLQKDGDGM